MKTRIKNSGFSLIEIMVVVAIIGILAGIAYPSYMESVRKSNRSDATVTLNDTAQRLQRCFTTYNAFNNANCGVHTELTTGTSKIPSPGGYYDVTISNVAATTYTLTASPVTGKTQASDAKCTKFTLTHAGVRAAEGSDNAHCW